MKLIVPKEQVSKVQQAFAAAGYGQADAVRTNRPGYMALLISHEQLCSKREMIEYLKEEGVDVK